MPPKHRFDVSCSRFCSFPKSLHNEAMRAARKTLRNIPAPVLGQKLIRRDRYQLSISIVGLERMKALNWRFRKKKRPTDVLSFSRIEGRVKARFPADLGDVIVCWPIAKAQAKQFRVSPREEIRRLVVHGVLHLFGYDHERSKSGAQKMFALEEKILRML